MSMLPLCKFCGERHPLLKCPEFDIVEQTQVLIKEAKAEVAKGMFQLDLSVPDEQVRIARHDRASSSAEQSGAGLGNEVLPVHGEMQSDGRPPARHAVFQDQGLDAVGLAADLDPLQGPDTVKLDGHADHNLEHPVASSEHASKKLPHRYTTQPNSERNLEPWKALGISRRTFYRRKKATA